MSRILKSPWLDNYILLAQNQEAPTIYYKWVGLVLLASALRLRVWLDRKRYILYPNLYVVFVAKPGCTRKSSAGDWAYDNILPQIPQIRTFSGRITPEKLLDELGKLGVSSNQSILENDASMFLYSSELSSLMKKTSNISYSIIDLLTDIYSKHSYDKGTMKGGTKLLRGVCINLLGCTTPNGVKTILGESAIEGGFTSRTIMLYQEKGMPCPWPEMIPEHEHICRGLVTDLANIANMSGPVYVTATAKRWFDGWYRKSYETEPVPELAYYWSRRHDHLLKLSILLSVSEGDSLEVRDNHMTKALSILEEAEYYMPMAFNDMNRTKFSFLREFVLDYIRKEGGRVSRSQLLRKMQHRISSAKELDQIIDVLIDSHILGQDRNASTRAVKYYFPQGE